MAFPIFNITDGTPEHRIELLKFLNLKEYKSSVIEPEGGGNWGSSPFADGRVPISMQFGNLMIEAMFSAHGCNEDDLAYKGQEVRRLLENAKEYWLSPSWKTPVWIEMRGSSESNMRYAYIKDYRAPGTGNPFAAPEFDHGNSMILFPLILETTPWQSHPLGSSSCIEIDNLQKSASSASTTTHFHIIASTDDANVSYPSHAVTLAGTSAIMGVDLPAIYSYFTIFRNITIPPDSVIVSAFIRYTASSNEVGDDVDLVIYGERNINPTTYCADYDTCIDPIVLTTNHVDWSAVAHWTLNTQYDTPDISNIIQEIINLPGWVSGSAIGLNVSHDISKDVTLASHRNVFTFDNGSKDPELHIVYVASTDAGRSATCLKEVVISNKHNKAQITHIFRYTKIGNVYDDLLAAGVPYTLFPAAPAVGDGIYIGIASSYPDAGPFRSLVYDLSVGNSGIVFDILYSQTAAFQSLAAFAYTDNTALLTQLGVSTYHFLQPLDFDHQVINGVNAWWIFIEITAVGGTFTVPTQQNRDIYTIVTPYFDIDSAQVKGDLPVLSRTLLYNRSYSATFTLGTDFFGPGGNVSTKEPYAKKILLATRRLSRGEGFTPYLNASDWQLPSGITYSVGGAGVHTTMVEDTAVALSSAVLIDGSPTGKLTLFDYPHTAVEPLTVVATWTFAYNIAKQYAGRYAAYLRCAPDGRSAVDFQIALQLCYGIAPNYTTYQTKTVHLGSDSMYTYIDSFSIMEELMESEYLANFHINLMIGVPSDTTYPDLYIYDLILVPIDEFVFNAETEFALLAYAAPPYGIGVYADADSIGNPKVMRTTARVELNNDYIANFVRMSRNPWLLNPRTTQRVWFFSPASLNISYVPRQYGVARYFDLRGKD